MGYVGIGVNGVKGSEGEMKEEGNGDKLTNYIG